VSGAISRETHKSLGGGGGSSAAAIGLGLLRVRQSRPAMTPARWTDSDIDQIGVGNCTDDDDYGSYRPARLIDATRCLTRAETMVYQVVGYYVTRECASCGILWCRRTPWAYLPLPPSRSWYSFTDPGGMEGWVGFGAACSTLYVSRGVTCGEVDRRTPSHFCVICD